MADDFIRRNFNFSVEFRRQLQSQSQFFRSVLETILFERMFLRVSKYQDEAS